MCAAVGTGSNSVQCNTAGEHFIRVRLLCSVCVNDVNWCGVGTQYEYRTWTDNNTDCSGDASTLQYIAVVTQCISIYSNLYSTESCTDTVTVSTSAACFPASEMVQLMDGSTKSVADVAIGDMILGANRVGGGSENLEWKYSEVIAVPHQQEQRRLGYHFAADFVSIQVDSDNTKSDVLRLSPSHIILASCPSSDDDNASEMQLAKASEVAVGCLISTVEGSKRVTGTSLIRSHGLYSVVTADAEFIVVNGVVASPFASNHVAANAFYGVLRWICKWMPGFKYMYSDSVLSSILVN
jgi:hypothetical protein